MTEDKQKLATTLYEVLDDLLLETPEKPAVSIDELITPSQKYSLIMSILNGLPKDSLEQVLESNLAFEVPKEDTPIFDNFKYKEKVFIDLLQQVITFGLSLDIKKDAYRLMIKEYVKAVDNRAEEGNISDLANTLGNLTNILVSTYTAFNTFNLLPVQLEALEEVCHSNLSKGITDGRLLTETISDLKGRRVISKKTKKGLIVVQDATTGEVLKPSTYIKPDLQTIINKHLNKK